MLQGGRVRNLAGEFKQCIRLERLALYAPARFEAAC